MPSLINHAAKLGSLLCRSKFESQQNNYEVINFRKNCTGCLYILKASLYLLHRFNNTFLLKNSINCETSNFDLCCQLLRIKRQIYRRHRGCLAKVGVNIYRQHIRQPQYQQLADEEP